MDHGTTALSIDALHVIEPRQQGVASRVRDVWRYRRLTRYFGGRYLQKMYARTVLGWAWVPLRPLLDVGTRALIFGSLLRAPSGGVPYFLFFLVGMSNWRLFDQILLWGTRSIEMNRRLVSKLYFPRLILPIASVVPALVEFAVFAVLVAIAALYYVVTDGTAYITLGPQTLLVIAGLLLCALLGLAISLFTAVWGAYARDVRFTLRYVLDFWFFITPVIYPLSALPASVRPIAALNPVSAPVEMIREGLFGNGIIETHGLVVTLAVLCVVLVGGLWYFARAEAASVDSL